MIKRDIQTAAAFLTAPGSDRKPLQRSKIVRTIPLPPPPPPPPPSLPEYEKWVTEKDIHVYTNPFSYLHAVLRGKEKVEPFGLYSLENNLMVNKILEAAKQSAATGKTVLMH